MSTPNQPSVHQTPWWTPGIATTGKAVVGGGYRAVCIPGTLSPEGRLWLNVGSEVIELDAEDAAVIQSHLAALLVDSSPCTYPACECPGGKVCQL